MNIVKVNEWKSGFTFRKVRNTIVWLICLLAGIIDIYLCISEKEKVTLFGGVLFLLIAFGTRHKITEIVKTSYQCMPWFNRKLTRSQQESIMSDEKFSYIDELRYGRSKHLDIAESEHWLRIDGYYISKELLMFFRVMGHGSMHDRDRTPFEFIYIDGSKFEFTLGVQLSTKIEAHFEKYFWEHFDVPWVVMSTAKRDKQIRSEFSSTYQEYIKEKGYASEYEALKDIVLNGTELKQKYKNKYHYFWERRERYYKDFCPENIERKHRKNKKINHKDSVK